MGTYRWKYINFHLEEEVLRPTYSVVTIVSNMVLNTWKLLRGHLKSSRHTHTHTHTRVNYVKWQLCQLSWFRWSFHNIYDYQIIMLYTQVYTNIFINCSSGTLKKIQVVDHLLLAHVFLSLISFWWLVIRKEIASQSTGSQRVRHDWPTKRSATQ